MEGVDHRGLRLIGGVALLVAAVLPQAAAGSTANDSSSPILIAADNSINGEANQLSLYLAGAPPNNKFHIGEQTNGPVHITSGGNCAQMGNFDVECPIGQLTSVAIYVHGGSDSVETTINLPATISGGDGS